MIEGLIVACAVLTLAFVVAVFCCLSLREDIEFERQCYGRLMRRFEYALNGQWKAEAKLKKIAAAMESAQEPKR